MTVLGGVSNRVSFAHYSQIASVLLRLCWQRHCLYCLSRSIHGSNIHWIESDEKQIPLCPLPIYESSLHYVNNFWSCFNYRKVIKNFEEKWLKQDSQELTLRRRQLRLRRLRPTFVSIRPTSALFLAYSKSLHWSVLIHHCHPLVIVFLLSDKLLSKSHIIHHLKRRVWISWASFASWFPSTIGIQGPTGSTFAPWEDSGSRVSC